MARVNDWRATDVTRVLEASDAELCQNSCGVVNEQKIFCSYQCCPECSMNRFRAYISTDVFRPFQSSSVLLGLTIREQLMSPEYSKHKVLSFPNACGVVNEQKIFCSISVL